jgi:hypothetical protein
MVKLASWFRKTFIQSRTAPFGAGTSGAAFTRWPEPNQLTRFVPAERTAIAPRPVNRTELLPDQSVQKRARDQAILALVAEWNVARKQSNGTDADRAQR